jgi:ABC-type enterochelin transport system ATPase subunit
LMGRKGGIEVENLVREFRKGPRAVDGISLRVEPGEVYGFLGPNGAVAVRLDQGGLADVVRALDAAGLEVSNLRLDEPSLNDVFLAKKGRSLEGAGEEAQT